LSNYASALLSAAALIASTGAAAAAPASWTVTPEVVDGRLTELTIEHRFRGDADGRTRIELPNEWAGARELWRAVSDVRVQGATVSRPSPEAVELRHAPGAPLVLTYRVRQDFQGELSAERGGAYRVSTLPDRFTAVGWALFATVEGREGAPSTFAWGAIPQGWTVASDLDGKASLKGADLHDSVLVGGAGLQIVERPAAGGTIRIAFQGDWRFDEERFGDLMGRIAQTSAEFWGDRGEDFFVAMTPIRSPDGATVQVGVGLGDAFSLWATPDVEEADLRHILAHEHLHTWFPGRLGGVRTGPDEPLDYWLSEGFTEFFTLRILLRAGVYSLEDYARGYNRVLKAYAASPVREAPNRLVAERFFSDRFAADLPYQRGLLLATIWDAKLRVQSGGKSDLDDVVLRMASQAKGYWNRGAPANFKAAYAKTGGPSLEDDFRELVDGGRRLWVPEHAFAGCLAVTTRDVPMFDRGFDVAATSRQDGVVAGVDESGPAFAAGLRNGMRIVAREGGDNTDSRVDLIYRVKDGPAEKLIRYRPEGRVRIAVQELSVPEMDPATREACTARVAGL
jgi:predicted metalloprotease with PDZ domain